MSTDPLQIDTIVDPDDEFGGDYDEPGSLRASDVQGAVVYTVDWTVATVVSQIDADPMSPDSQGVIVTEPPFQRRRAWTNERQGLFIESLMLGLPVPPLVLAESMNTPGQFYVLDGKQRLTALRDFYDTVEPLRLSGLEILSDDLNGLTLREIVANPSMRDYARSLAAQPIRTIVVRNWKNPSLLHLIFSRLNKASVPLASHELRQALYPGEFTNYINKTSAESSHLMRARRLQGPDFRLRDAETLLRYIAFRTRLPSYRGDLRRFLDATLKSGNDHFGDIRETIEHLVLEMEGAIDATFTIFGRAAFLRYDASRKKYLPRFNLAVFDIMTWFFSDHETAELAIARTDDVRQAFETLVESDRSFSEFLTSTTKSPTATQGRLEVWGAALGKAIGIELSPSALVRPIPQLSSHHRRG